ncbi:MAG: hypothetical protein WBP64_22010 [Nitrososphaeraceae archaeon]
MVGIVYKVTKLFCSKIWNEYDYYFPVLALVAFVSLSLISIISFMFQSQSDQIICTPCKNMAYAQNSDGQNNPFYNNVSQQWTDKTSGVKIIFAYSPAKPLVDSPTELRFLVRDLKTDKYFKDLLAHVIITTNSSGQERTFKFNNITAPNGNFSLKYLFPDYGTYQIIANVRSNTSAVALASFQLVVPLQASNMSSISAMPAGIAIVIVGIAVLVGVIIKIRKPY